MEMARRDNTTLIKTPGPTGRGNTGGVPVSVTLKVALGNETPSVDRD